MRALMARAAYRHFAILAVSALALAACQPGKGPLAGKPAEGTEIAPAKPQKSTRLVDRDVEAPDVFQVTDAALWDGRPSLGGVWVASPDTKDPERVIMRNPANGKFVIGALFRRERDNPGPALQISSDAAAALGILAGAPANISVTALRREEAEETAPEATKPILDAAETVETQPLDGEAPMAADKPAKGASDTAAIATAALDAAAPSAVPDAAPAAPAGKKKVKKTKTKPVAEEAPAPEVTPVAPASPPVAAAPVATGGRPIQIGFFSVEANAKRAVDTLAKAGIAAETRAETSNGKPYWSVIARGDAATLKKIKAAGFGDAYLLK